uniref:CASP-like protein n=1 Tax=Kalanchoe fedtschenkoi TaxID=63787 RepID=A0A7N0UKD1_KALFE
MKSGPVEYAVEAAEHDSSSSSSPRRGLSILDFVIRVAAFVGTLASGIAMGTTDQRLPFFTRFIQFKAEYDDLPALTFFVAANGVVSAYLLILGMPLSVLHIIRTGVTKSRVLLIIFDTVMLALLAAAASAAASIVYLAHKGNPKTNWLAICQQFRFFCRRISGSLIGSFGAMVLLAALIILSAIAVSRRPRG